MVKFIGILGNICKRSDTCVINILRYGQSIFGAFQVCSDDVYCSDPALFVHLIVRWAVEIVTYRYALSGITTFINPAKSDTINAAPFSSRDAPRQMLWTESAVYDREYDQRIFQQA